MKHLTITELESYYNMTQRLIDDTINKGRMSMSSDAGKIRTSLDALIPLRDKLTEEFMERIKDFEQKKKK